MFGWYTILLLFQISATMISVVWAKIKPILEPFQKQYK